MWYYIFWLFITNSDSIDNKNFDHKDGNFKLSMCKDGKRSVIHVQEKIKCQLYMYNYYKFRLKDNIIFIFSFISQI